MSGSTDAKNHRTHPNETSGVLVRFWGTRGSLPVPGHTTLRYGGNTSCVEIDVDGSLFIFDAGTGLRSLGTDLLARNLQAIEAHLFCSHTHWDHIKGFPFFVPAYHPSTKLHVYELTRDDERIQSLLGQMRPGYFPVTPTALKGQFLPKYLQNGETQIGNVTVRTLEQKHPGRSFAYRLTHRDHSVVYATDSELDLLLETPDVAIERPDAIRVLPRYVEDFVRHADLLIADAQYTDEEYPQKIGWGHSRLNTVVDLAVSASVRQLALFHHEPHCTDEQLDVLVKIAQKRAYEHNSALVIFAAAEGQSLVV